MLVLMKLEGIDDSTDPDGTSSKSSMKAKPEYCNYET